MEKNRGEAKNAVMKIDVNELMSKYGMATLLPALKAVYPEKDLDKPSRLYKAFFKDVKFVRVMR